MDTVLLLPAKVLLQVVNYYGALQRSSKPTKIFHVVSLTSKVVLEVDSMLAIEPVSYKPLCVEAVQNFVGVLK